MRDDEIDAEKLVVLLQNESRKAIGISEDEMSAVQDDNLKRYLGEPYGDEIEGASQAMSYDVAEVVDWALPDLLEPFLAGEDVVRCEPRKRQHEDMAKEATDLCNYIFRVDNDGDIFLHDCIKTALIQKVGVAKISWEDEDTASEEYLTGLTAAQVNELVADPAVEILEHTPRPAVGLDPELMAAYGVDGQVHDVAIRRTERGGTVRVMHVPPEQFRISIRATTIDGARYVAHVQECSKADLIEMGFDEDAVRAIEHGDTDAVDDTREDTRFFDEDFDSDDMEGLDEVVVLHEEYIRTQGRLYQCFRVGKSLLTDPVEIDEAPFEFWTPDRIPGRMTGLALADKVKGTQRIKTALTRALLDNQYLAVRPRFDVPQEAIGENTLQDLLTYRVGGLIRTKRPGMIAPIEVPDLSATAMQAIMYFDSVREQQSGITKNGMAISSEVVDPKSATESRRQDRNEQVRKKLMIRMIANTFLVRVFRKMLRCVVRYQDFVREIQVGADWRVVDPRGWDAELRVTANVGLGHANREENLMAAQIVTGAQAQALEVGLTTPKHIYATAQKLIEAVGWSFPERYFLDPESDEAQQMAAQKQQQPDPEMAKVQAEVHAKMQLKQVEMQMDAQAADLKARRDIEVEQLKAQAKMAVEREKADFDYKTALDKISAEYDLGMQRLQAEMMLKREQMQMEARIAVHRNETQAETQRMRPVKFGGEVG